MANGGDIDRTALVESFSRIKEDIARLTSELHDLKTEHKKVLLENKELKKNLNVSNESNGIDKDHISQIVLETLKHLEKNKKNSFTEAMIKKLNKNRKNILKNRIETLAAQKNLSLPDVKEIIVDKEELCSKATFYRYMEKMKKQGIIDFMKINDMEVVVTL